MFFFSLLVFCFFELFCFCLVFFFFNIVFLRIEPLFKVFNLYFLVFVNNFVPLRTQSTRCIFTCKQDQWPDCSLHLLTLLFIQQVTSISPLPFSSLPSSVNLFVYSRLWRTFRELITGWICLSPFDSPFYPPGHLCFLPPSFLLCVNLWTSLRDPDCGEYIGKWLLASLLSPLLISPLLLVTSISFLPLLFSM